MTLHLLPASAEPALDLRPVRRRVLDVLLNRRDELATQVCVAESHDDDAGGLLTALQDVETAIRAADSRLYRRRIPGRAQSDVARAHEPGAAPDWHQSSPRRSHCHIRATTASQGRSSDAPETHSRCNPFGRSAGHRPVTCDDTRDQALLRLLIVPAHGCSHEPVTCGNGTPVVLVTAGVPHVAAGVGPRPRRAAPHAPGPVLFERVTRKRDTPHAQVNLRVIRTGNRRRRRVSYATVGIMGEHDPWLVRITDDDIHSAKADWQRACDAGAPATQIAALHDDLRRLVTAQAQQIADDFRRQRRA